MLMFPEILMWLLALTELDRVVVGLTTLDGCGCAAPATAEPGARDRLLFMLVVANAKSEYCHPFRLVSL